jgi:hypothetical protein
VAGDVVASATLAPRASGARTLARLRACSNVTGPAAPPDFGVRASFRERDGLVRVGFA